MENLGTTKLGSFNLNSDTSTPAQISAYLMSALSAESVALGGGMPDINSKAINNGIAIGLSALAVNNVHGSGHGVAIGCETSAVNYGVAIGEKAKADCAFALGPDALATNNATAIGRYAAATGNGSVQLNGDNNGSEYKAVNSEDYTLKFYAGDNTNVTVVNKDKKVQAGVVSMKQPDSSLSNMAFEMVTETPTNPKENTIYIVMSEG